jgi:hypothetical protein
MDDAMTRRPSGILYALALRIVLALFVGLLTRGDLRAAEPSDHRGLYVRIDPSYANMFPAFDNALSKDFVDGAAVMMQWATIAPQPGIYDWSAVDVWLADAVSKKKKLSIGLMAGWFTPQWLYEKPFNVPKNSFSYNRNPQGEPICTILALPSPWDRTYIEEFNTAMSALAQHLRQLTIPGQPAGAAYDAVKIVKISGINNTTEELRLVANRADNGPCNQSDAQSMWAAAGFRPGRIVKAWQTIADSTAADFPEKLLSIDIIQSGAFPPVDEAGSVYRPQRGSTDALTNEILAVAVPRFGKRLAVQWDALSQTDPNPAVIEAGRKGATVAWQLNQFLGPRGGTGCIYGERRTRCKSDADFWSILENGLRRDAAFIEIWAPNVDEYPAVFQRAHCQLSPSCTESNP